MLQNKGEAVSVFRLLWNKISEILNNLILKLKQLLENNLLILI